MEFTINRINTVMGIFRLSGELLGHPEATAIRYSSAEFMGTDGWVAINTETAVGLSMLNEIKAEVIEHLTEGCDSPR